MNTNASTANKYQLLGRIQAISGALFAIFLAIHLTNTLLAGFSAEFYDAFQQSSQQFYQLPIVELGLIILPLIAHSIAGVYRYLLDRQSGRRTRLGIKLQTATGFFLLVVIWIHILATRGVAYWFDAEPGFIGVAFTFWWMPVYFYPYYFILFMAGFYHVVNGIGTIARRFANNRIKITPAGRLGVLMLAAIGVSAALLSFGGVTHDIPDPRESDYARVYSDFLGIDLYPVTE